jgi:hypothetical protein
VTPEQLAKVSTEHQPVLTALYQLGRAHLLVHDLAVGKLLLQEFFSGDALAYQNHSATKVASFRRFAVDCRDELQLLGHSEDRLQKCVRAHIVFESLPPPVKERLQISHLLELGRCRDSTTRARLAIAATQSAWSVQQLRSAVSQAKDGQWDPTESPAAEADKVAAKRPALAPGRVVSRGHKLLVAVGEWKALVDDLEPAQLSDKQRQQLHKTLKDLQDKLAQLAGQAGALE